jgi:surface carbohydrate biosynthesis protein
MIKTTDSLSTNSLLLVPVENQVRELDPKLLFTCIAAQHGFTSIIGSRREMELNIDAFPSAIYLSKSMTVRSLAFFRIARRFGHKIVAWDEEALVHLPPETYYSRRLDPSAIKYVLNLIAWGQDNVDLWRLYPQLPVDMPIHAAGNPRGDMLRAEMRRYYEKDAEALRKEHGNFILVNTNFNHVNAFGVDINLFKPAKPGSKKLRFGRAARGMTRYYAKGLWEHKQELFAHFKALIPRLEQAFPDYTIVVRPHPTENPAVYQDIARGCQRVKVTNEGNVVPWLMATKALVHNGCTTAVEANVMGVPALSYRPVTNSEYDDGFYRLPNRLSHECFKFEALQNTLQKILEGGLGAANGTERQVLINRYLAAQEGPLACERIIEILKKTVLSHSTMPNPGKVHGFQRWVLAKLLNVARRVKTHLPGSHNRPEYQLHRYPILTLDEVRMRLARFQELLGQHCDLKVARISKVLFQIKA